MRAYFNELTHKNLDIINNLKEETISRKKNQRQIDKILEELTVKNKNIKEPLEQANHDLKKLKVDKEEYETQKIGLKKEKKKLPLLEKNLKDVEWRYEVLFQRNQSLENERGDLLERYNKAMHDTQQKSHFKKLLVQNTTIEL